MVLRTMSGYNVPLQPGSVLMYDTPVAIESHADTQDLGRYWCLRVILSLGHWCHPDPAAAEGHARVHDPTVIVVCAEVWVLHCH